MLLTSFPEGEAISDLGGSRDSLMRRGKDELEDALCERAPIAAEVGTSVDSLAHGSEAAKAEALRKVLPRVECQ